MPIPPNFPCSSPNLNSHLILVCSSSIFSVVLPPPHLAARQKQPECLHAILDNGALVCASTDGYSYLGSMELHMAAHGGSVDCFWMVLAWGADRLQLDSSRRIPFSVALKHKHKACAALLDPSPVALLVWSSR
ncbi:hypothetical protein PIB30_052252 [Stylosanthes scabra]|uniref:Uncharacterized protein n=1 Tax=Stylosanthes scabra TaxID=79078 RepID=A0ABU6UJN8_9FABA|nr:hypothetical protein [Stylosanthes scabra]